MTHYGTSVRIKNETDNDWLAVGSKIGELVNNWANRSDLVTYVGENAGAESGAPASFNPASAEINVNTRVAFGFVKPEHVGNLNERKQQFEFPKATGAIFHEALHAKFSTWDLAKAAKELPANVCKALHLLEESRIESYGVRTVPSNKSFLRACALEIVLADMNEESFKSMTTTRQASHTLALTYARVDAGVLEVDDVKSISAVIDPIIKADTRIDLQKIWREFQTLRAEFDEARMYELAYEWERVVAEQAEENGEAPEGSEGEGSEGGEGISISVSPEFAKALAEAIQEAQETAEVGAFSEGEEQQTQEEYRETADAKKSASEERKEHKDTSAQVFSVGSTPNNSKSNSELRESRVPTTEERIAAVQIAQALEKAKYRDRVRIESASMTPPGRLRTRSLVQGEAIRERNPMAVVEPFRRVQRKHTEDPNLTVGVMVDISGSMRSAMNPMASAAWILSEAGKRIQAKTAMVYFGNDVFPTLRAGQHLDRVNVYTASDGTEKFDKGFKALDGALDLLNGSGARLLVIVSDGQYTWEERPLAQKWLNRCAQAGVGVLWIGAGSDGAMAERYCEETGAQFVRMRDSATDAAQAIGRTAATALTNASAMR
jgi:hypothetical protein